MAKKSKIDLNLNCSCGAKSPVIQTAESKWYSHCISCGRLTFWSNPMLTERLRYGGKLCPHNPESKDCKGGKTSFCPVCRIRVFLPGTTKVLTT
ncbi:MAG: hypothetical protein JW967_09175 [Dehalococcoidales bacterium]|nr:hypothetical protein [Dehalococcoidales bacterium]